MHSKHILFRLVVGVLGGMFLLLAILMLFVQGGTFGNAPHVKVTWVRNFGTGTYGYVENVKNEPLFNVVLILNSVRATGRSGFVTGAESELIYPHWGGDHQEPPSKSCDIPADKRRRFDFPFPITSIPADIEVIVNGQRAKVTQVVD